MNFDIIGISAGAVAVIPIIVALVQAVKMTGWVDSKYAPLVSIAIGIAIGFIANHDSGDLSNTILTGVLYGLSASGLYSGVKETSQAVKGGSDNPNNPPTQ